ncbi:MAG TPA: PDR/VanB family oxidoreductase [Rhodoferax sp.]|nr:PDR/VanB family oxidoreductase [Rhodoferax sp.]
MQTQNAIEVKVVAKAITAVSTAVIDLETLDGSDLPAWKAGSHIELSWSVDGQDFVRQYSLCGERFSGPRWRIAVHREKNSRGGSAYLCDQVSVGTRVKVRCPRNNFPFVPDQRVTFLAAGIGITPLLPMAFEAEAQGCDWRLVYLVCEREDVSLRETLDKLPPHRVSYYFSAEVGRLNLGEWTRGLSDGDSVFVCGPLRLLDDMVALHEVNPIWKLHLERFENPNKDVGDAVAFDLVLARSGKSYRIQPNESILDVLRRDGMNLEWSCCDGVCGTCEQVVVDGVPDHRDAVLTPEERKSNRHMMICVSRAATPSLTLDL